jgi:ankyrin repeat protein
VVALLLAKEGVDPNLPEKDGWTPLMFAVVGDHAGRCHNNRRR